MIRSLSFLTPTRCSVDSGLLLLRLGIGGLFLYHGTPKMLGGPETWSGVGGALSVFGITFWPTFWGLCAALSEFVGGLLLILGLGTRLVTPFIAFTMVVAIMTKVTADPPEFFGYPLVMLIGLVALFLTGPGRFALDQVLLRRLGANPVS